MGLGDLVFSGTNLRYGLYSDIPDATLGSIYVATDTNNVYVCYATGVWANVTPERSNFDKLMLTDLSKNWYDLSTGTDTYYTTNLETSQANSAYTTVWKRFQGIKINGLPDGVNTLRMRYTYRLAQVDLCRIFTKIQVNGIDVPDAFVPESAATSNTDSPIFDIPVSEGDLVQVYGYIKNKGTAYVSNFRILGAKTEMFVWDVSTP